MAKDLIVLDKDEKSGYTTFKNHDEELVSKIKSVEIEENTFSDYRGKCKLDKELSNGNLQFSNEDGDVFTIDKKDFEENKRDTLLNKINNLYPVHKYFNDNFGNRICVSGSDDELGYNDLNKVNSYTKDIQISEYKGIELSSPIGKWVGVMFCYFNEDGNYVNRDYNVDIERVLSKEKQTPKMIIEEVSKNITDLEYKYDAKKERYFADEFMLQFIDFTDVDPKNDNQSSVGFSLYRVEKRYSGKYGNRGENPVSCPKNTEIKTKSDIIEKITPFVDKLFKPIELPKYEEEWVEI